MSWPCGICPTSITSVAAFEDAPQRQRRMLEQVISPQNILLAFGNPRNQGASYFYCSRWLSEWDINFRAVDLLRAFAALVSVKDKLHAPARTRRDMRNKDDEVAIRRRLDLEMSSSSPASIVVHKCFSTPP